MRGDYMYLYTPPVIRPLLIQWYSGKDLHRTPEFLLSLQPFYHMNRSSQIIITRYWVSVRFALLGRLEKAGMKNIRIKI